MKSLPDRMPILRVDLHWTRLGDAASQATWETFRISTWCLLEFERISSSYSSYIVTIDWVARLKLAASGKYSSLLLSLHQVRRVETEAFIFKILFQWQLSTTLVLKNNHHLYSLELFEQYRITLFWSFPPSLWYYFFFLSFYFYQIIKVIT